MKCKKCITLKKDNLLCSSCMFINNNPNIEEKIKILKELKKVVAKYCKADRN